MDFRLRNKTALYITILYFLNIILYAFLILFELDKYIPIVGFFRIPILGILYFMTSKQKKYLFFIALFLYQIATLIINKTIGYEYFYGVLASDGFRFILLLLVFFNLKKTNIFMVLLFSIPCFILYMYFVNMIQNPLLESYYLWAINAVFTPLIGGIAIVNYLKETDEKSFWLLISAILFLLQAILYYTNDFYVKEHILQQLVVYFHGISIFTFYKFLLCSERIKSEKHNLVF